MKTFFRTLSIPFFALALVACDSGGSSGGKEVTKVVVLGDSITAGLGATPYPSIMANILGKPVINEGQNGRTSAEGLAFVRGALARHQPSHLVVLLGTNDAILGSSQFGAGQNVQAIVDIAREQDIEVIVGTIPPITRTKTENDRSRAISGYLADVGGARIVDIRGEFGEDTTLLFDGVHPNNAGQNIIAVAFAERLQ